MSAIDRIADLVPGPGLKSACILAALEHGARPVDALPIARSWYAWLIDIETESESREGVVAPVASAASAMTEDAADTAPLEHSSSQAETATPITETAPATPNQMRGHAGLESLPAPTPSPFPAAEAVTEEAHDDVDHHTAPCERETWCTATPAAQAIGPSPVSGASDTPTNRTRITEYLIGRGRAGALVGQMSASLEIKPTVLSVTLDKMKRAQLVVHIDQWWYAAGHVPLTPNPRPTKQIAKAARRTAEAVSSLPPISPDLLRERITTFLDGQGRTGAVETGIARAVNCSVSTLGAELSRMNQARLVTRTTMGLSTVWRLAKFNTAPIMSRASEPIRIEKPASSVMPPIGNATRDCKKCRRQFRPEIPTQDRCNICLHGFSTLDLGKGAPA